MNIAKFEFENIGNSKYKYECIDFLQTTYICECLYV